MTDEVLLSLRDVISRPFWNADLVKRLLPGAEPWPLAAVKAAEGSAAYRLNRREARLRASRRYFKDQIPLHLQFGVEDLPEAFGNVAIRLKNEVIE